MSYYPQLPGGIRTQLPSSAGMMFDNFTQDSPTDKRYSFANIATPVGRWGMNYTNITDAELATLETYFNDRIGRLKPFTFLDPHGNLVPSSENFLDGSWTYTSASPSGPGSTDPYGGNSASAVLSSSTSVSKMAATVLPDGNASGITLCASAFAKINTTGSRNIVIGFSDSGVGVVANTQYSLTNSWRRITCKVTLTTNGVISVFLGPWDTGVLISLFGFQVSPMPGPGAYTKSPDNFGLHRKCYFASDAFPAVLKQYGSNQVSLGIVETK